MLNPTWLRTFAVLAEEGSFTRTGARIDLTQAAVSQHLHQLERELGPLLIRRPRAIELTPAGMALLDYCRDADHAERRLRQRLRQDEDDAGEVALITPGSIGLCLYPWLLELQEDTPGLAIRHRFAPDSEVLAAVLDNRYAFGLVTLRPDDRRLASSHFAEEPLELVLPAGHQLTGWDGLVALGFIDHPDGLAMATRLLSRQFPGAPGMRHMPCSGFSNQIGLILEPVARGLGFTVLPRFAREAFARQDAIAVVDGAADLVDTLWLIHRAEWPLSNRAQRTVDFLAQRLRNRSA